ncbi:hypothetical protein [Arsenicicoccus cauae]|uniref:hypothetical protein n=1 Tax=Arsenicicoccus cauae TaxID=2663847 RepID=UPI0018A7AE87|nr:hypothetical protein [Arsenicicoccus cauae]
MGEREAERVPTVTAENIRRLLSRVSVMCRRAEDITGPVSLEDIRRAFSDVCGYQPDEDGIQVVMRLPGLGGVGDFSDSKVESRKFIDEELAEAAFGDALTEYIQSPYHSTEFGMMASWQVAGDGLAAAVAAAGLEKMSFDADQVKQAIKHRGDRLIHDAVLLEVLRTADEMGTRNDNTLAFSIQEVISPRIDISAGGYLANCSYEDCVMEHLDLSDFEPGDRIPSFNRCLITNVHGISAEAARPVLKDCEVGSFELSTATTSAILDSGLPKEVAVAISILKKVYVQRGAARKIGALTRGLPLGDRPLVQPTIDSLVSAGWLARSSRRGQELIGGNSGKREAVFTILRNPPSSRFW